MEHYPDPPPGWLALREKMRLAQTPAEVNQILQEMERVLDAYEAKLGSRRRSPTRPDLPEDAEHPKSQ